VIWRSRRMPGPGSDAQLDALLAGAWEDGAAAVAGTLDLAAGKAALLATRDRQDSAGWPVGQSAALAAVRGQIDALLAELTSTAPPAEPGPAYSAAFVPLMTCHQFLVQLRAGLIARAMPKPRALEVVAGIEHALAEADRTLRELPSAISGPAGGEIQQLREQLSSLQARLPALAGAIERLFDDADDLSPRVPVPSR